MHTLANVLEELGRGEFIYRHFGATVDDYYRLANEDTRLELIDGVLTMHSPASIRHESIFKFLLVVADGFVNRNRLGTVLGSRVAVKLDADRHVEPDIIFLRTENLARLGEVFVNGPVDWVVEVLSPATRDHDLGDKRRVYADAGIPEVWFVDPLQNRLLIDRPAGSCVAEISSGQAICESIPGFWIKTEWLWQNPLPSAQDCLASILAH